MTKPNCENTAAVNLERQGYSKYLPRFKTVKPDKTVLIKPLFPRYLFVFIEKYWSTIRSTRGVANILLGNEGPAYVPTRIIDNLRAREGKDGFFALYNSGQERFCRGDTVKTVTGPLAGQILIYDTMPAKARVRVLANLLGSQVPIIVDEETLVAA